MDNNILITSAIVNILFQIVISIFLLTTLYYSVKLYNRFFKEDEIDEKFRCLK